MIEFDSMDSTYWSLIDLVKDYGYNLNPRGKKCVEVRPAAFRINNADETLYTGKSRKLNYTFFAVEALTYIAGWYGAEHAKLMCAINPKMEAFVNKQTNAFDGAYGFAIGPQLPRVAAQLAKDILTRQAVISIWSHETNTESKDVPCTTTLHFFAEPCGDEIQLSMAVYMRSNDLNWGLPYDVPAFSSILCVLASCLGVHVGRYNHFAGSLHYYEEDNDGGEKPPKVDNPEDEQWSDRPELEKLPIPPIPRNVGTSLYAETYITTLQSMINGMLAHMCLQVWDGVKPRDVTFPLHILTNPYLSHWAALINGKSNR